MTTRRTVLKAMSLGPAVLAGNVLPSLAAPDPSRISLVIGNSAYRQAPLTNPTNDAAAMRDLLNSAGFTVEAHLDAKRSDLLAAIDRFAAAAQQSLTRLAVFYYAGHGVQLDWRNYLLPVDVAVNSAEDVKRQCIDLASLLGRLAQIRDKNFVIILDACRDDPFRGAYRPEQKGLSQFDAPVGSLIAYATSPGSVASDGGSRNGLYTENLVRELAIRDASLEDALKRVRLNVRLSSSGQQIPWESTSLESKVFVFTDGARKLSAAELEQLVLDDLAAWGRIKNSRNIDDWVRYLREFPNGRFAEIAQVRMARLLAEDERLVAEKRQREELQRLEQERIAQEKRAQAPPTKPAALQVPLPAEPNAEARVGKPVLEIGPEDNFSFRLRASTNPFSAGRYPLGRKYTVGDLFEYRRSDILTGVVQDTQNTTIRISRVDESMNRVEGNDGEWIFDELGNVLRFPGGVESDIPQQLLPAELQIGRKWTAGWITQHPRWGRLVFDVECHVEALEEIAVPAGNFMAFRVRALGWVRNHGTRTERTRWVMPGIGTSLRTDILEHNSGQIVTSMRWELVRLVQHAFHPGCAIRRVGRTHLLEEGCTI